MTNQNDMNVRIKKTHLALLVIGCPDRGLELELDFFSTLRSQSSDSESMLPKAARTWFARMTNDKQLIDVRARQIILTASIAAGGAGFQPLPSVPDAALIAPIQTTMIVSLAKLNGYDVTPADAIKLVGPVIGIMAGRIAFEQIMKLIPGVGSALGATVVAAITLSLGQGIITLMKRNIWQPEKEAVLQAFNKHWAKNKTLSFQSSI